MLIAETNANVAYNGIRFTYDASLAYRIEVDAIAAITGAAAENTMYGVTPSYQRFTLAGYAMTEYILEPQLFVMPVSEFPDTQHIYGERLLQLQTLLAEHPDLSAVAGDNQNALPILPVLNAAQMIASHPQYMRFGNGLTGSMWLQQYSHSMQDFCQSEKSLTTSPIGKVLL